MLFLCYYCGGGCDTLSWAVSGILHNPFLLSLGLWMTISKLCLIVTPCYLNTDVHPEPQILTINKSDMCVRLGNICPSRASSGKAGKSSKHGFLDCMV